jgi:glycosyltransferase involved in cell wall biosynthesis
VTRALEVNDAVLVVDDGSTDRGAHTLEGLDVRLVRHPKNLGKGAAILTAAREARRLGMTHMVTLDADGQHDPSEFRRFVPLMREHPKAIVVGKRDFQKAHAPRTRRFGRSFSNFWLRVQTGHVVGDAQSGFRAYPLVVFERLRLAERGFPFEIEVLVKAAWAGMELRDVDVSVFYPPPEKHISHFHLFRDNARLSLLNARLTMRSMFPWPHRKIFPGAPVGERISFFHPIRSLRTLLTGDASPARLATAGAMGVFLGALPLIALHTAAILFASGYFRLNKIAALGASQLCMPPLVPALCIETGYFLRHGRLLTEVSLKTLGYEGLERILEWVLGSLLLGPALAVAVGGLVYGIAIFVKREKSAKI